MPAAKPPLLRIGPFSRLAGVTIKTLRFYDSAGLLVPACIDPRTGYRFYRATQLPALRRIRLLRELGCSIAEIRGLLSSASCDPGDRLTVAGLRTRLMIQAAQAQRRLRQLDALLAGYSAANPQKLTLTHREIAPTPAFTIRDCVRPGGSDIHDMFESAEREVARCGTRALQSPFLLLHDMEYRRPEIDVEVCIPTSVQALGSSGVRLVEPVTRAACIRFQGDYDQAPPLLDAALESMRGTGDRITGPIREVYLRFGADQRGYTLDPRCLTDQVAQYRTELQIPLQSAAGRVRSLRERHPHRHI